MAKLRIELPPKLIPIFTGEARYRGAYGGRGSAKTRSFAKMIAVRGLMYAMAGVSGILLCGREYMNSLDDSSMAEVKAAIASEPWLTRNYDVGEKYIRTKTHIKGRVDFKFAGLRQNIESIRSKARILIMWVDEAEAVSEGAWRIALPTVLRDERSEVWATWNPKVEDSPTDKRFRKAPPLKSKIVEMNYEDNPWFPDIMRELMEEDKRRDYETYKHVWLGGYETKSEALIFKNWTIAEFTTPDDARYYHGADWGFANDPTALVRCYIIGKTLYIDREAVAVGCDIETTPALFAGSDDQWSNPKSFPGIETSRNWPIVGDSARPETISHMCNKGFNVTPAIKGPGSVEDGITFIKSYDVVIHPRCTHAISEFGSYSYKVDPKTEEVLPIIVDKNNHCVDALRYALEKLRRANRSRPPAPGPRVITA